MKRLPIIGILLVLLLWQVAGAESPPLRMDHRLSTLSVNADTSGVTNVVHTADFEHLGSPDWDGWTSVDNTYQTDNHWQVDDYMAENLDPGVTGNHAWVCNTFQYPACSPSDSSGGYGNNWHQVLEFVTTFESVPGKAANTARLTGLCTSCYRTDDEDWAYVRAAVDDDDDTVPPIIIGPDSTGTNNMPIDCMFVFDLANFEAGEKALYTLRMQIGFVSDHRSSDEDCEAPSGCGIAVDNLRVFVNGDLAENHVEDCESATLWNPVAAPFVGDFAQIRSGLDDDDPCAQNPTPQVIFVDDGNVVPGTGGSFGINHTYGYLGCVLNSTGGLAGPDYRLHNEIRSPVLTWPGTSYTNGVLEYDLFQHSPLAENSPGMFTYWRVRSTTSTDSTDLADAGWRMPNYVGYGSPGYQRMEFQLGDLIEPGSRYVQVALGVRHDDDLWPTTGQDATPAPYFDNVRVTAWQAAGPLMWAHPAELAQDAFPPGGSFDHTTLLDNGVRFDMARNASGSLQPGAAPGDSIVCHVAPLGVGAALTGPPVLHYLLEPNAFFDPVRTRPLAGSTSGTPVVNEFGTTVENLWAFDLPDTNLLFPGDRLHYYIRGEQNGAGGINSMTLPADTTDFNRFGLASAYDHRYIVRALPTVTGWWQNPWDMNWYPNQPQKLWWNDADDSGSREAWIGALRNLGYVEGTDFDIYETNAPDAGVGNGLGGRATPYQITMYNKIAYSAGDHGAFTLGTGEAGGDPSPDTWLLENHPAACELFLTGAHWVSDLDRTSAGQAFTNTFADVNYIGPETAPRIGNQRTIDVRTLFFSTLIDGVTDWTLLGSCYNDRYDAIEPAAGAIRAAEYLDPAGATGTYTLGAWVIDSGGDVWSMPYDLSSISEATSTGLRPPGPLATRTHILKGFFSGAGGGTPTEIPELAAPRVHAAEPNPFNPRTTIRLDLPRPTHVTAEVFDVRGRLVRRLAGTELPAGRRDLVWDGKDTGGRDAAAGVYFCRIGIEERVLTQKLALIR